MTKYTVSQINGIPDKVSLGKTTRSVQLFVRATICDIVIVRIVIWRAEVGKMKL